MRNRLKSILVILFSNITTVIAGLVVGFVIPKILSIEEYGYFKAFTLYVTYIGFFSLGIIDGIVLKHGSEDYKDINKQKFRAYFIWYVIVHIIFTIAILVMSFIFVKGEYKYIFSLLSINIIALNFAGYFQQVSQITQRFNEYSNRNIVRSVLTIFSVLIMYVVYHFNGNKVDYKLYVLLMLVINYILTLWYISTYKDLIFGAHSDLRGVFKEIIALIKLGFPLLFANLCSTLILTIDRQFINILFGTSEFAVYAFAYNLLGLVTIATSAISIVLFPTLKRTTVESLKYYYSILVITMTCLLFGAISIYFPLVMFIGWYLPVYSESLTVFRIILPTLVLSSLITVIMHNYYKVLNDNIQYFKKSIIILLLSGVMNWIAYSIFGTVISISIASIITMFLWYIYVDLYFVENYNYNPTKNILYILLMTGIFYSSSSINNNYIGLIVYLILYIIITMFFYYQLIQKYVILLTKKVLS